jgi:hypothetical protein
MRETATETIRYARFRYADSAMTKRSAYERLSFEIEQL